MFRVKWVFLPVLVGLLALPLPMRAAPNASAPFICGADLSFLQQLQDTGAHFYDANGLPVDELAFFHDQGVNYVRLRIWVNPSDGYNDLAHTLVLAKRIKAFGMGLLLDFHYSDTWTDPAHQTKPAAWTTLSFTDLEDMMYTYTKQVVGALSQQGTPPDMVQIGNEITVGLLWEEGRVDGEKNWPSLIGLLQAGVRGVREAAPAAQIMLHIAGNQGVSQWFFDHIIGQVDFDIIGLSYYPWWSGALSDFESSLGFLAKRYNKPFVLAETGYPWTLKWADNTNNYVGEPKQLAPSYPATPQGQLAFMTRIAQDVQQMPNALGKGFFYWAPDDIAAPKLGSFWENVAQFDFQGHALPSMRVYAQCKT